jgi:hypothetical protein
LLNSFGEVESGLSALLVHVQKNMIEERFAGSTTRTVQEEYRKVVEMEKENKQAKLRQDMTLEQRLEVKNIEEQIEIVQAKLTQTMNKKIEETKNAKDDRSQLLDEYDTEAKVTKITSKQLDFIGEIFPTL